MPDPETFLVELYVAVDTFCKTALPPDRHPGPAAALDRSEVLTLALFGQWGRFASERDVWRYAEARLRPLFPRLPSRPPCHRQVRRQQAAITALALHLAEVLGAHEASFAALDGPAVPTRNAKRRGRGWLPGIAEMGCSKRRGWYEGMPLLVSADPAGVVTGWGCGPASSNDRARAETLFAHRATPIPALPSAGRTASGVSVADAGFAGVDGETRGVTTHHAQLVAPPQGGSGRAWPPRAKRWVAGIRQVIETVFGRLLADVRLERERPHTRHGVHARLAAKIAVHNACVWLNRQQGRPDLAVVDLLGW